MKVLVTGASGFIGRHVINILQDTQIDYLALDIKEPPENGVKFRNANIVDIEAMNAAFSYFKPSHVIHLAAFASMSASNWSDFKSIWRGTEVVCESFSKTPGTEKFLNVSTQLVEYPGAQQSLGPYNLYAQAKLHSEQYLRQHLPDQRLINTRPTNIWGPYHPTYGQSVLRYIDKGIYLQPIMSDSVRRTYGYVQNTANQLVSLLHTAGSRNLSPGIFLGDICEATGAHLDRFSKSLTGKPVKRVPTSFLKSLAITGDYFKKVNINFPFDTGRFGRMTTDYTVDISYASSINSLPISIDEAVEKTVEWYKWQKKRYR